MNVCKVGREGRERNGREGKGEGKCKTIAAVYNIPYIYIFYEIFYLGLASVLFLSLARSVVEQIDEWYQFAGWSEE